MSLISVLKDNRWSKILEKQRYERRREQIQNIIDSLSSSFSDDVSDVNKKVNSVAEKLAGAMKGIAIVSSLQGDFYEKKESNCDGKMADAKEYLVKERSRCDQKIEQLQSQISGLDRQISNAEAEEAAEAAKAAADTCTM